MLSTGVLERLLQLPLRTREMLRAKIPRHPDGCSLEMLDSLPSSARTHITEFRLCDVPLWTHDPPYSFLNRLFTLSTLQGGDEDRWSNDKVRQSFLSSAHLPAVGLFLRNLQCIFGFFFDIQHPILSSLYLPPSIDRPVVRLEALRTTLKSVASVTVVLLLSDRRLYSLSHPTYDRHSARASASVSSQHPPLHCSSNGTSFSAINIASPPAVNMLGCNVTALATVDGLIVFIADGRPYCVISDDGSYLRGTTFLPTQLLPPLLDKEPRYVALTISGRSVYFLAVTGAITTVELSSLRDYCLEANVQVKVYSNTPQLRTVSRKSHATDQDYVLRPLPSLFREDSVSIAAIRSTGPRDYVALLDRVGTLRIYLSEGVYQTVRNVVRIVQNFGKTNLYIIIAGGTAMCLRDDGTLAALDSLRHTTDCQGSSSTCAPLTSDIVREQDYRFDPRGKKRKNHVVDVVAETQHFIDFPSSTSNSKRKASSKNTVNHTADEATDRRLSMLCGHGSHVYLYTTDRDLYMHDTQNGPCRLLTSASSLQKHLSKEQSQTPPQAIDNVSVLSMAAAPCALFVVAGYLRDETPRLIPSSESYRVSDIVRTSYLQAGCHSSQCNFLYSEVGNSREEDVASTEVQDAETYICPCVSCTAKKFIADAISNENDTSTGFHLSAGQIYEVSAVNHLVHNISSYKVLISSSDRRRPCSEEFLVASHNASKKLMHYYGDQLLRLNQVPMPAAIELLQRQFFSQLTIDELLILLKCSSFFPQSGSPMLSLLSEVSPSLADIIALLLLAEFYTGVSLAPSSHFFILELYHIVGPDILYPLIIGFRTGVLDVHLLHDTIFIFSMKLGSFLPKALSI